MCARLPSSPRHPPRAAPGLPENTRDALPPAPRPYTLPLRPQPPLRRRSTSSPWGWALTRSWPARQSTSTATLTSSRAWLRGRRTWWSACGSPPTSWGAPRQRGKGEERGQGLCTWQCAPTNRYLRAVWGLTKSEQCLGTQQHVLPTRGRCLTGPRSTLTRASCCRAACAPWGCAWSAKTPTRSRWHASWSSKPAQCARRGLPRLPAAARLDTHQGGLSSQRTQPLARTPRCLPPCPAQVSAVHYPGLECSPYYERARGLFTNGFGGVLSFELAEGVDAAEVVLARLQLAMVAPSLGGVETLVTRPATTSHAGLRCARHGTSWQAAAHVAGMLMQGGAHDSGICGCALANPHPVCPSSPCALPSALRSGAHRGSRMASSASRWAWRTLPTWWPTLLRRWQRCELVCSLRRLRCRGAIVGTDPEPAVQRA